MLVVIPCHNHSKYVAGSVQSVLDGHHKNIKVICVEDGSSDSQKQLFQHAMQGFSDPRLIVEATYQKSGRWRAVNQCIEKYAPPGSFDYVTVLDADDEWLPDRLTASLRAIVATGAAASLVGFHHCWDEGGLEWIQATHQPLPEEYSHSLEIIDASTNFDAAKDNFYRLRFGGGFPCADFEPHSVSATFPLEMWWQGYRFMPGELGLRLSPGEDTCMALRLAMSSRDGLVIAKTKPYLYRRNTTTNQSDIKL